MSDVIAALLPVFLLIIAGHLLKRTLLPEDAHWVGVEQLVYFVMFPALLIDTLARADLPNLPVGGIGGALAAAIIAMAIICLALRAPLAARFRVKGPAFTSLFQGATRWNTFVALAVAANLFGTEGVALASVAMLVMIPLLNVINVWVLAHFAATEPPDWRSVLLALARNPLIWSCAIGIAINVARIPYPGPIHAFADALGRSSLALGLLMVGAGLQLAALARPVPAVLIATALKLLVMPAMATFFGYLLGLSGTSLAVVAIAASVPSAPGAYVLARQMGGDAKLVAQILTLQTLTAALTMPLVIALVR